MKQKIRKEEGWGEGERDGRKEDGEGMEGGETGDIPHSILFGMREQSHRDQ